MTEEYCGIKFRTIFLSRKVLGNPKIPELINWCKEFDKIGFTPTNCGNFSFRAGKGFIISCSKAQFSSIRAGDFVEVVKTDIHKKEVYVNGLKEPSAESFLHNDIYTRRKDVNAVFHGHSKEFLSYGPRLQLPVTEKEQPSGSMELMTEVAKILGNNSFILMKNHGFLSLGDSIGSAGNLALKRYTQLKRISV